MANDPSTKLQVNFKWEKDGDMINIYAANQAELEQHLTSIQDLATLITSTSQSLRGVSSLRAITPQAALVQAIPVVQAAAPVATGVAPTCSHGVMNLRSWTDKKTGQPVSGYLCASPKGTPNQCRGVMIS